jgi:hypothetical protein
MKGHGAGTAAGRGGASGTARFHDGPPQDQINGFQGFLDLSDNITPTSQGDLDESKCLTIQTCTRLGAAGPPPGPIESPESGHFELLSQHNSTTFPNEPEVSSGSTPAIAPAGVRHRRAGTRPKAGRLEEPPQIQATDLPPERTSP